MEIWGVHPVYGYGYGYPGYTTPFVFGCLFYLFFICCFQYRSLQSCHYSYSAYSSSSTLQDCRYAMGSVAISVYVQQAYEATTHKITNHGCAPSTETLVTPLLICIARSLAIRNKLQRRCIQCIIGPSLYQRLNCQGLNSQLVTQSWPRGRTFIVLAPRQGSQSGPRSMPRADSPVLFNSSDTAFTVVTLTMFFKLLSSL